MIKRRWGLRTLYINKHSKPPSVADYRPEWYLADFKRHSLVLDSEQMASTGSIFKLPYVLCARPHQCMHHSFHGITVNFVPVPAVSPWGLSPLPRSNHGYRGVTVIPIPVQLSTLKSSVAKGRKSAGTYCIYDFGNNTAECLEISLLTDLQYRSEVLKMREFQNHLSTVRPSALSQRLI